jgi:hypothetical protein
MPGRALSRMPTVRRIFDRLTRWALHHEASTRSAALVRIGLALIAWTRFGGEVGPWQQQTAPGRIAALVFFVVSTAMLLGWHARLASALTAGCLFAFCSAPATFGGGEGWTHHHVHLLAATTLLCACTPCGRSYSIDRLRALRAAAARGEAPPLERGNLWGLRLIALQMSTVYLFAAIDKTTLAFLSGARLEHLFLWQYWGSEPPHLPGLAALLALAAIGNVALEYALAFGLLFAASRRWLLLPGLALHAIFYLALPVATYSATVFVIYLAYVDADHVHALIEELSGRRLNPRESPAHPPS